MSSHLTYNLIIEQTCKMCFLHSYLSTHEMLEACRWNPQIDVLYSLINSHLKEEGSILFQKVQFKMKAKDYLYNASKCFAKFSCQVCLLNSVSSSCNSVWSKAFSIHSLKFMLIFKNIPAFFVDNNILLFQIFYVHKRKLFQWIHSQSESR